MNLRLVERWRPLMRTFDVVCWYLRFGDPCAKYFFFLIKMLSNFA